MGDIYLGRLLTREGADNFERAMAGENVQIGPTVKKEEIALSTVRVTPNYDKFYTKNAQFALDKNKAITERVNSYCMVADDLEDVMESLKVCAYQPTGEEALVNINNDRATAEDYFGRDRVSVFVIKMDENEFRNWCDIGCIGYDAEGGKYELDGETRLLAEAIVSDRVIRHSIKEGQVFGYDEVHKLFDLENMEYDPDRLFNRSYTPSMRIHQGQKVNNEPSKNTTKYNSEYDRLRQEILLRDDMTKEDKKLMLEALNDAFNMETDPNDEMDIV